MNTTPNEAVAAALRYDPLAEAEKLTGQSYKESEGTSMLGFAMRLEHAKNKRALLEFTGDTYFGIPWTDFKAMLPKLGFKILFVEPFLDERGKPEEAICAWNETYGALLWTGTFRLSDKTDPKYPPGINGGQVYFCWRHNEGDDYRLDGASHGPISKDFKTRHVSYDIREGLKHHLNECAKHGQFVKPWPAIPFLWLLTYMDTKDKDYDYKAINKRRLDKLPDEVKRVIGHV